MKKSYTSISAVSVKNYDDVLVHLSASDVVYLDSDVAANLTDFFTESVDWKTPVNDETIDSAGSDLTITELNIDGLSGKQFLKVEIVVADEDMPTAGSLTLKAQNAAGTTDYEERTIDVGAITAGNTGTFYVQFDSFLNALATRLEVTGTLKKPAANTLDCSVTVTPQDLGSTASGATFTIGTEAGNAIVVAVQLLDSAGADVDCVNVVDVYLSEDARGIDISTSAEGISVGTDGILIGTNTADQSLLVGSELDGDVDISISETTGADEYYLVVVLPDGKKAVSDKIIFAA